MRKAIVKRKTKETDIELTLNLDGSGKSEVNTGIGFFDHMLTSLALHSMIDIKLLVRGDLNVDNHHTVEDIGISLGMAIKEALGNKEGIVRFADCFIPMDEALAFSCLDLSGRGYLVFNAKFSHKLTGEYETDSTKEFFNALADNGGFNLHMSLIYGDNDHHKIEALFKAFARCLKQAKIIEGGGVPSSKGSL